MQNNNDKFEKILEQSQNQKTKIKKDDESEALLIRNIKIKVEKINSMIARANNARGKMDTVKEDFSTYETLLDKEGELQKIDELINALTDEINITEQKRYIEALRKIQ